MSASRYNANGNNRKTTFVTEMKCKVCFDAGKSKDVYSSHWVKDQRGKVICPTLLSQKCQKCLNFGHTVKFCTVTEKTASVPRERVYNNVNKIEKVSEKQTKNLKEIIGDFPALNPNRNITYRAHQKQYPKQSEEEEKAELAEAKTSYLDVLRKASEMKKIKDLTAELRATRAEREANEARGIVEKPILARDITDRGCGRTIMFNIEEGEEYDPFFGSDRKREIKHHNQACFTGAKGLSWIDVIESESEEEEEEREEEDYDW